MASLIVIGAVILVLVVSGIGYLSISGDVILKEGVRDVAIEEEVPKDKISVQEINQSPEIKIDKCKGIFCQPSFSECPDGLKVYCNNTCSSGICSNCKPDCSGHENVVIVSKVQTSSPVPSKSPDQQTSPTSQIQESNSPSTLNPTPQQQIVLKQPKIVNVNANAEGDDRKKENWNTEWIEINGQGIDMSGWTLQDNSTHKFAFPDGFIINGLIKVRSGYGNNTQTDLYFGDGPVWNNDGDVAYLKDKDGNLIDEYSYGE